MKIKVNESLCIGAGQCELFAPSLFKQDDESGLVVVLNDAPSDSERQTAEAAVLACPTRAIYLED